MLMVTRPVACMPPVHVRMPSNHMPADKRSESDVLDLMQMLRQEAM